MSVPDASWAQGPNRKEASLMFCWNKVRSVLISLAKMHPTPRKYWSIYNLPETLSSKGLLDKNLAYNNFLDTLKMASTDFVS